MNLFFNISAFFFFYFPIIGIYIIFLPKVLQTLGYTTLQIGVIFAIAPLMRFLIPFFFVKHFTINKSSFLYALGGAIVAGTFFYLTIDNFWLFVGANLLFGGALGVVLPYIETASIGHLGRKGYGRSRLYGSISFALIALVVPRLVGDFSDTYGVLHFFMVSIVLTTFFGYRLAHLEADPHHDTNAIHQPFTFAPHLGFWINVFLVQVAFGALYNFFTIYETDHGISLDMTGYLWAFGVLCEIVMLYFQSHLLTRFSLRALLLFSTLITAFRWSLLYLFPRVLWVSYLSQSFHAFSFALYHSTALLYLYHHYTDKRLAGQFFYGISFGLGSMVGALVAGYTYGSALFLVSTFITLYAFVALLRQKSSVQKTSY